MRSFHVKRFTSNCFDCYIGLIDIIPSDTFKVSFVKKLNFVSLTSRNVQLNVGTRFSSPDEVRELCGIIVRGK